MVSEEEARAELGLLAASPEEVMAASAGELVGDRGPLTRDEAQALVGQIRSHVGSIRSALLRMEEGRGWKALGFSNWRDWAAAEFDEKKTWAYQTLTAGRIEREISANAENGYVAIGTIPESHLRPLARLKASEWRAAWNRACSRAGSDRVTGALVSQVVEEWLEEAKRDDLVLVQEVLAPKKRGTAKLNRTNENVDWAWWTWNPVTGCLHDCPYSLGGETLVLMADSVARKLQDVRVGDRVIGTRKGDTYRHYTATEVSAVWSHWRPAYRVTLGNGMSLVTSADHRFLTRRQLWKYVIGAMSGCGQRPYLTTNDSLLGLGVSDLTSGETDDYRRGYLSGVIRGDGHLKQYRNHRRLNSFYQSFRLAMKDEQTTERAADYLLHFGVEVRWFDFAMSGGTVRAIRTSTKEAFADIQLLIADRDSREFRRGFLAGMVDAEGSNTGSTRGISCLRIYNSDAGLLALVERTLSENGFRFTYDADKCSANKVVRTMRVMGGLSEHLRLFQWADPILRRKLPLIGAAVKNAADLSVVSIEPLGIVIPMYDITTGTEDFIANGVVAHNCYARDIANRFYPQGFKPTFLEDRLGAPSNTPIPHDAEALAAPQSNRIFVCSMADLFGKWVPQEWIDAVLQEVRDNQQWKFLFLTKFPQRLAEIEWPENAWVGTTVDKQYRVSIAEKAFRGVKAGKKWLSCEPLLEPLKFGSLEMFDWVVIGGASRSTQTEASWPDFEWVVDLYNQARAAGCKVYFKPNTFSTQTKAPKEQP